MAQFRICRVHEPHGEKHFIVERRSWFGRWRPVLVGTPCGGERVAAFKTSKAAQAWIDEEKRAPVHECGEVQ